MSRNADAGVPEGGDREEGSLDNNWNQAPSSLVYPDGEGGKAKDIVVSEGDKEEEVDELNSSEYEGLSMVGMLVNTDMGGYYEKGPDNMDVADNRNWMDVDNEMSEADMDNVLPEEGTNVLGAEMTEDEILVKMEVDGETCLFSWAAIAELHLLRENTCLRGEEMDEELEEFSEEREYGDLISTVIVQAAPVAGPSQPRRGQTGGNSKYLIHLYFPFGI
jgi:hypothetical protein